MVQIGFQQEQGFTLRLSRIGMRMRSLHLVIGADGHGVQTLEVIAHRFVHNAAGSKNQRKSASSFQAFSAFLMQLLPDACTVHEVVSLRPDRA
jgi:hypothetical protein